VASGVRIEYQDASAGGPEPGWYAVSVNHVKGIHWFVFDGKGGRDEVLDGDFRYFDSFKSYDSVGYSIRIYLVTRNDANRVRRELGLLPLPE
jgi:hypothetical protein